MSISAQDRRFWEERGLKDSMKGRNPAFKKKHGMYKAVVGTGVETWTPEEEDEAGSFYMNGYEGGD